MLSIDRRGSALQLLMGPISRLDVQICAAYMHELSIESLRHAQQLCMGLEPDKV